MTLTLRTSFCLLAALLLLPLAACDSANSIETEALIGTWTFEGAFVETTVTSRTDQSAPDLTAEGNGAVTVSGGEPLRFALDASAGELRTLSLLSVDPASDAFLQVGMPNAPRFAYSSLYLVDGPGSARAQLLIDDATTETSYEVDLEPGTVPFEISGGRVTVPTLTLTSYDGTRQVTVGGVLTFPVVDYRSGRAIALSPQPTEPDGILKFLDDGDLSFAFEPDGTLRVTADGEAPFAGRWEATGNAVRLSFSGRFGGGNVTTEFSEAFEAEARIDGDRLTLVPRSSQAECDAGCRSNLEARLLLATGSLTRAERETAYRLTRR